MNKRDPKLTALLFNENINARNLEGVIALMADNHKFIDSKNRIENKEQMKRSWKEFFNAFPDYRNIFHTVISRDNFVILLGHSENFVPNAEPVFWTAKIENDQVAEWRIYLDTKENRKMLSID